MRYHVIVHAPVQVPDDEGPALERLRASLEAKGLEIVELRAEDWHEGGRSFHIESYLEAPSSYHASNISGPLTFSDVLSDADIGMTGKDFDLIAQRPPEAASSSEAPAPPA